MLNQEDFIDNEKVGELIRKLNVMDEHYMANEIEVIARRQPFIISLLLGYQIDFNNDEYPN